MKMSDKSENEELGKFLLSNLKADLANIGGGAQNIPIIIPKNGSDAKSLKHILDEYLPNPERMTGNVILQTQESFTDFVNKFQRPESLVFANTNKSKLTAVIDYHDQGNSRPQFGEFRAHFECPLSNQLKKWLEGNDRWMDQADFAHFIEDSIFDVVDPPNLSENIAEDDKGIANIANVLGTKYSGINKLITASRGLKITVEEEYVQSISLASGETKMSFSKVNKAGATVVDEAIVPEMFLIVIPIYRGGSNYRLAVRLRHKTDSTAGRVKWKYEVYRLQHTIDHAFTDVVNGLKATSTVPVYIGEEP
jgi:uncharacterized protein YfdQ (DUF2303 family)